MIKNWFQSNQHKFIIPTIRPWASYLTSPRSSLKLKSLRKKLLFFEHNNEINNKHLEEDAADVVVVHIVKDLLLRQRPDLQVWVFVVVPLVMMVIMSDGEDDEGGNRDDWWLWWWYRYLVTPQLNDVLFKARCFRRLHAAAIQVRVVFIWPLHLEYSLLISFIWVSSYLFCIHYGDLSGWKMFQRY